MVPRPLPIPGVSQSSLPGENNIEKHDLGIFLKHLGDLLPPPSPSQASVKVPFRGKQIYQQIFPWRLFLSFKKKIGKLYENDYVV